MRTPTELRSLYREHGLRVTPQRELVVRILSGNTAHPSAEVVYQAARAEQPTISLKTVYQVLHDLNDLGEIQVLDLGTGSFRFDPNTSGHHHIVCNQCGAIVDVTVEALPEVPHDQMHGFQVVSADVIFRGVCAACIT